MKLQPKPFRRPNQRSGVDAGRTLGSHLWRYVPGATHRGCSAPTPMRLSQSDASDILTS